MPAMIIVSFLFVYRNLIVSYNLKTFVIATIGRRTCFNGKLRWCPLGALLKPASRVREVGLCENRSVILIITYQSSHILIKRSSRYESLVLGACPWRSWICYLGGQRTLSSMGIIA